MNSVKSVVDDVCCCGPALSSVIVSTVNETRRDFHDGVADDIDGLHVGDHRHEW